MSDVETTAWLSLADVARDLAVCRTTVWRWVTAGVTPRGGGAPVVLQTRMVGRRRRTTAEWLADFQAALDGAPVPGRPTAAEERRSACASQRKLRRLLGKHRVRSKEAMGGRGEDAGG